MKNGLKYLIAILVAGSLGIWFIPLLNISIVKMSVMDVMKIGLGFYNGSTETELIYGSVQTYLSACAWGIAGAAVFVLIEAFLTAVLGKRKGYIISLISCIVNAVAGVVIFALLWSGVEEVKNSTILILAGDTVNVSFIPLAAWLGIYLLIFILSIVGICLWSPRKNDRQEEIYIEQISRLEQDRETDADLMMESKKRSNQKQERSQRKTSPDPCRHGLNKSGSKLQEKTTVQNFSKKDIEEIENFSGALIGMSGLFIGKAYPLENVTEVYFREEKGKIFVTPYEEEDNLAGVYYINQYQEYCVEPTRKLAVFLESGQPLGMGRKYYLPRGTKVYLCDKENLFTLA